MKAKRIAELNNAMTIARMNHDWLTASQFGAELSAVIAAVEKPTSDQLRAELTTNNIEMNRLTERNDAILSTLRGRGLEPVRLRDNWPYTNVATVWPHIDAVDEGSGWGGGTSDEYGTPYHIACTWVGGGETATNSKGVEFAPKMTYFHEDKRVKFGDLIARGATTDRSQSDPIQAHDEFDMSFFGEEPDFKSVT